MASLDKHMLEAPRPLDYPESFLSRRLCTVQDVHEFFEFFEKGGSREIGRAPPFKFVYCARVPTGIAFRPYDIIVVRREQKPLNHFVVSPTAVVHVRPGHPPEVFLMQQWLREAALFDKLRRLAFFRQFIVGKMFRRWLANLSLQKFMRNRAVLAKRLFIGKQTFQATAQSMVRTHFDLRLLQRLSDSNGRLPAPNAPTQPVGRSMRGSHMTRTPSMLGRVVSEESGSLSRCLSVSMLPQPAVMRLVFYPDQRPQWGFTRDEFLEAQHAHFVKVSQQLQAVITSFGDRLRSLTGDVVSAASRVPDVHTAQQLEDVLSQHSAVPGPPIGVLYRQEVDAERLERKREMKRRLVEYDLLHAFFRLADTSMTAALFSCVVNSVEFLSRHLELPHHNLLRELRLSFKLGIVFQGASPIQFTPRLEELQETIRAFIWDTIARIGNFTRYVHDKDFTTHMHTRAGQEGTLLSLEDLLAGDEGFNALLAKVSATIERDYADAAEKAKIYEPCRACLGFVNNEWPDEHKTWPERAAERDRAKCLSEADIRRFIARVTKHKTELHKLNSRQCGVLALHIDPLVAELNARLDTVMGNIKSVLASLTNRRVHEVGKALETNIAALRQPPMELREFCDWVEQCAEVEAIAGTLISECNDVESLFVIADEFNFNFPQHQLDRRERTVGNGKGGAESLRALFLTALNEAKTVRNNNIDDIRQQLQLAVSDTTQILVTLHDELSHGDFKDAAQSANVMLHKLGQISGTLQSLSGKKDTLNKYSELLGSSEPAWAELVSATKAHEKKQFIWRTVSRWEERRAYWNRTPVGQLDGEKLREEMIELFQTAHKLHKGEPDSVTDRLVSAITVEKANMTTMVDLSNPALKEEHWLQIFDSMGKRIVPPEARTLETLRTLGAYQQQEAIAQISGVATGEYVLVKQINRIASLWDTTSFILVKNRDQEDCLVLGGLDDIKTQLEEHQIQVQTCLASRYVEGIRGIVEEWDTKLQRISDVLDEWVNVQKAWIYLEFVFSSDDIKKQLPEESKMFAMVNKTFRGLMATTARDNNVAAICAEEGLLESLRLCTEHLDKVQKRLEDYLETKRAAFPRFYFLSNDELLSILSDVRNPMAVQPHMQKCFDNIKELDFDGPVSITAMKSTEGEVVKFSEPIKAIGNVENWLNDIERMMRVTLYDQTKATVEAYTEASRNTWYFNFPAQCISSVDQIIWTRDMEEVWVRMGEGQADALVRYLDVYKAQILNTVSLVKGKLSKLERTVVCTLIVVDVHNRDVISSLIDDHCESTDDFNWQKQLRYYWAEAPGGMAAVDCHIHHSAARFTSGYEYLGNQLRLVITPLTERAFLTCTSALHIFQGAAPQGPAGTGKTESVKDLGKALSRQVVVFNCSDGLNYRMMSQMFAGLAQAGAWACFDEFNRIELEVLSVIAQQMLEITTSIANRQDNMIFDGRRIRLHKNFGVFITMNPGYAGRTELPDNLKALFRPICMMIPDYALIAEIMFFSEGFSDAKPLAQKMVRLYSLASQQLSKQDHYDFGMRAVKSILVMAGSLKRAEPDSSEDMILIRAMRDSNVPKFLRDDTKLFLALINDLFPQVDIREVPNPQLASAIGRVLTDKGLQHVELFITKILQLYETMVVRHGVMLVGQTLTGKTTNANTLADALTLLHGEGFTSEFESHRRFYEKTRIVALNPKSITMGEMYGDVNRMTREWQDGVLSSVVRDLVKQTSADRYWVTFDGPVDAIWIENMNTVLDDNKLLCLVNGERIKIPDTISIVFEVQDLRVASPATVSRCGMVYMEPHYLDGGWLPIATSKSQAIGAKLARTTIRRTSILPEAPPTQKRKSLFATGDAAADEAQSPTKAVEPLKWQHDRLIGHLTAVIPPLLRHLRGECAEFIATVDSQLVVNLVDLLHSSVLTWLDDDGDDIARACGRPVPPRVEVDQNRAFDMLFVQALVWAMGGNVSDKTRASIGAALGDTVRSHMPSASPAEGLSVFDVFVHKRSLSWLPWTFKVPAFAYNPDRPYFDLLVPTPDTVVLQHILGATSHIKRHTLINGVTGTGKSSAVSNFVVNNLKCEDTQSCYASFSITFSAQTSSANLQETIESKLVRRRGEKEMGPPPGKTMVCIIDDCNMPQLEVYGASPPIELMRQMVSQGGFYDRKRLNFKEIVDLVLVCCCGEPGGGKNELTPRFTSQFVCLCLTALSSTSMRTIFNGILGGFLSAHKFPSPVTALCAAAVDATLHVYNRVSGEMLPTPEKTHYTFNLRDISKVVQGMMMVTPQHMTSADDFTRLWAHEASRVFHDRLINERDREWWHQCVGETIATHFKTNAKPQAIQRLLYGAWADKRSQAYKEISDQKMLHEMLVEFQTAFNTSEMKDTDLTFFDDAIGHLARICRILRQPRGNALLVGVGGSGRHSLCELAAYMSTMECRSIVIVRSYGVSEFRDDVRKILLDCGAKSKQVVFLLSDNQLIYSQMLEDVNNLLNIGEVPGLMGPEDFDTIMNGCRDGVRAAGKPETRNIIYQYFVSRCREHMHIILCMSPVGSQFRDRLRMFPALVNCMTIDWYTPWPHDALLSVSKRILAKIDLGSKAIKDQICELAVYMHVTVADVSAQMLQEVGRRNSTTPTSYLSLLSSYAEMYSQRLKTVADDIKRYQNGVDKLLSTNTTIETLKRRIREMQPVLANAAREAEQQQKQLTTDQKEADAVKAEVSAEEEVARRLMDDAEGIKQECADGLAEAMPALQRAEDALNTLQPKDIQEIKVFASPPANVAKTLDAVLCLLGKKEGWASAKLELNNMKFLQGLQQYDKDNISAVIIRKLKRFTEDKEFTPEVIEKTSLACRSLCMWVLAIDKYYHVAREVAPKRERLMQAQEKVDGARAELSIKQSKLATIVKRLADLERAARETADRKRNLENQITEAEAKLGRADQLIGGLATESARWKQLLIDLKETRHNVVGSMCLAAGAVAYLGPFTSVYRSKLLTMWADKCRELQVPVEGQFALDALVGSYTVREWALQSLPLDPFSVENATILHYSKRWCLMIDPQGQANTYIRKKEAKNKLKILKLSDDNYMRAVESAIQVGHPVLLENVGEELDAALDPVLLRQAVKQGGRYVLKLGEKEVEYDPSFRMYITTKLPNPVFTPELQIKVNVINFTVTRKGLEDQQLADVVAFERADLQEKSDQCVVAIAKGKNEIKGLEDSILSSLAESSGDILDNVDLINTLSQSKKTADAISRDLVIVEKTNAEIDIARERYRTLATRGSLIYGVVANLAQIDPMYQYSLRFFAKLFVSTLEKTPYGDEDRFGSGDGTAEEEETMLKQRNEHRRDPEQVSGRVAALIPSVTWSSFSVICRGLFEKDKLLFAFLLTVAFKRHEGAFSEMEWNTFLKGGAGVKIPDHFPERPAHLEAAEWLDTCALAVNIPAFAGLHTAAGSPEWVAWLQRDDLAEQAPPAPLAGLSVWQRALLVKAMRPAKLVDAMRLVVTEYLSKSYTLSPQFNLKDAFADSNNMTPLIFVLSSGTDPTALFTAFAEEMGYGERKLMLSLGQDQGRRAAQMIEDGRTNGHWVYLQNCHVYVSWMPALERLVETMRPEETHPDFRLWLTSNPSPAFPVPVLQSGMKLTREPPKGLKANLKDFAHSIDPSVWEEHAGAGADGDEAGTGDGRDRQKEWKRLVFTLAFFHALVQERRKFGPLGWNIPYEWGMPDLAASIKTLRIAVNDFASLPWTAIRYVTGVINYGGRVTDFLDQRCLLNICNRFFAPTLISDDRVRYDDDGVYGAPPAAATTDDLVAWVDAFPRAEPPELFGLHANADISFQRKEALTIISTLIAIQPQGGSGGGGGKSQDQIVSEMADDLLSRLPIPIDPERAHPSVVAITDQNTMMSLGTVLLQEIDQFNRLLRVTAGSLNELRKAIRGEVVMSATMEAMYNSFSFNRVPENWKRACYLSLKPLSSYYTDLIARVGFLAAWCYNGMPASFWLPGLFFPQGFVTGVYQTHSRQHNISIDRLKFRFNPVRDGPTAAPPTATDLKPIDNGVYCHGFFLDGAAWRHNALAESTPGILFDALPPIHFEVVTVDTPDPEHVYECPLYKASSRAGTLSTTGLSTNFVLMLQLPSPAGVPQQRWIDRGVGALCMLDS